jgi:hypothetical protein
MAMALPKANGVESDEEDDVEDDDGLVMQLPEIARATIGSLSEILMISIKKTNDKNCRKMINTLDYFKITMKLS